MTDAPAPGPTPPAARWTRAPALAYPDFRRLFAMRMANTLGINAQAVAVGWQVYDIGRDPFHLGLIGLVQFLPAVLLVLVSGAVADRFDRRIVASLSFVVTSLTALTLMTLSIAGVSVVWPFILVMAVVGTARSFVLPTLHALAPNVVPAAHIPNAIAINSIAARSGAALGPLLGGVLYGIGAPFAYAVIAAVLAVGAIVSLTIRHSTQTRSAGGVALENLTAGLRYIGKTKVILGGMTFDFFVTLMSGVNALLPVFARDILEVGPSGLGLLRASPAMGAMLVAGFLSLFPMRRHAGTFLFATIGVFGVAAIAFGLSSVLWLSVAALIVMGGSDIAGVYFRWSIVQLWTPDEVRGRVTAVASVSASGSNEIGDFRAGMFAAAMGPVAAVVLGGALALIGVATWMRMFPQLRRIDSLEKPKDGQAT